MTHKHIDKHKGWTFEEYPIPEISMNPDKKIQTLQKTVVMKDLERGNPIKENIQGLNSFN